MNTSDTKTRSLSGIDVSFFVILTFVVAMIVVGFVVK
jgi:hypothetical protein